MALLVASLAVAEGLPLALGVAAQATLLALAAALRPLFPPLPPLGAPAFDARPVLAAAFGYFALALAVNRALAGEKRRLSATLAELARLKHGIDQLADEPDAARRAARERRRGAAPGDRRGPARAPARPRERARPGAQPDPRRGARGDGRRTPSLYFDLDRQREQAHLRVSRGPGGAPARLRRAARRRPLLVPVERGQPFYATDFKRLLLRAALVPRQVKVGIARSRCRCGRAT